MKYLTVDGMFSGTGIRDSVEGGYLKLDSLELSLGLKRKIINWLRRYEDEHYSQYEDKSVVADLDSEGLTICLMIESEIPDLKIEYYSAAEMKRLPRTT